LTREPILRVRREVEQLDSRIFEAGAFVFQLP
jgi:hypothetical protein